LTHTLGVEKFGIYSFSFAIIQYFTLVVNYGFDYSATKYVSINRDDNQKISLVFSAITLIRGGLALVSVLVVGLMVFWVKEFHAHALLYLLGVGIFIGQGLTPLWLFQGMEKMKFVTIVNFSSRLISTLLIFIFLSHPSQYQYVNLFFSIGYLCAAILSILLALRVFNLHFALPDPLFIKTRIKEGWHLFLSTAFMSAYRQSNVVILGALTNYSFVGYYAAAEKIVKAVQSIINPLANTLYPYFGRKMNMQENRQKALKDFYRFSKYYAGVILLVFLALLGSSSFIVTHYLDSGYARSIINIQIMSPVILIGGLNFFLGIVGLVNLGYEKRFTFFVFIAGMVSVIACVTLAGIFKDVGAAISMLVAESVLLILILIQYKRNDFFFVRQEISTSTPENNRQQN
jgi:polysaccharide transporter, PST family